MTGTLGADGMLRSVRGQVQVCDDGDGPGARDKLSRQEKAALREARRSKVLRCLTPTSEALRSATRRLDQQRAMWGLLLYFVFYLTTMTLMSYSQRLYEVRDPSPLLLRAVLLFPFRLLRGLCDDMCQWTGLMLCAMKDRNCWK